VAPCRCHFGRRKDHSRELRRTHQCSANSTFGPNEQAALAFSWNCNWLDMSSIPSSFKFISIPASVSQATCTVTVRSVVASIISRRASVDVVPVVVVGAPPSLTFLSTLPRIASTQNLAISVRVSPGVGVDALYIFE